MDFQISNKLKNFETVSWLKNRFKNQVKDKYILNDKELKEQTMMKAVFKSIDRDKSSMKKNIIKKLEFLDRSELYDMFKKYGINITKIKLKEFFKKIDQDDDDKLNWHDFKQALQNQEALQMFVQLMRKIREENEKNQKLQSQNFVPLSFPNMIQYMNYCVLREELIQKINSDQLNTQQKLKQCKNLLSLEEICYRNIQEIRDEIDENDTINYNKKIPQQQFAIQKRLQEKEDKQVRQGRIKRLSDSQYYKSDTEQTARSIKTSNKLQNSTRLKQENKEFKLIESLTDTQQDKKRSQNNKTIFPQMIMSERINPNLSDTPFQYKQISHRKQRTTQQTPPLPRGSHFINQELINIRTPLKTRTDHRLHSPKRIRVISQMNVQTSNTKSQM